jgi:hypothetical protein
MQVLGSVIVDLEVCCCCDGSSNDPLALFLRLTDPRILPLADVTNDSEDRLCVSLTCASLFLFTWTVEVFLDVFTLNRDPESLEA